MTSFRREDWQDPNKPVTGPPPKAKRTVGVIHWSGGDSIPSDKKAWLREMQASYLSSRGYSLGYGFLVDGAGHDYEIRGADFNMASNPGDKVSGNANDWTLSVLLDVNLSQQASAAAIATVKRLFADAGIGGRPVPHSFYDYTQCCGTPVTNQINAGQFDPGPTEPTYPHVPPVPTLGGSDVFQPIFPIRNSDTRGFGGAGISSSQPHKFGLNPDIFPDDTNAIALNVTVIGTKGSGFLVAWPNGTVVPKTSVVNYLGDGTAQSSSMVVGINDGAFMLKLSKTAHVICDITGYWTT